MSHRIQFIEIGRAYQQADWINYFGHVHRYRLKLFLSWAKNEKFQKWKIQERDQGSKRKMYSHKTKHKVRPNPKANWMKIKKLGRKQKTEFNKCWKMYANSKFSFIKNSRWPSNFSQSVLPPSLDCFPTSGDHSDFKEMGIFLTSLCYYTGPLIFQPTFAANKEYLYATKEEFYE